MQSIRTHAILGSYIFYFLINSKSQLLIFKFVTPLVSQNLNRKICNNLIRTSDARHQSKIFLRPNWIYKPMREKSIESCLLSMLKIYGVYMWWCLANSDAFVCGLKDQKESYHLEKLQARAVFNKLVPKCLIHSSESQMNRRWAMSHSQLKHMAAWFHCHRCSHG